MTRFYIIRHGESEGNLKRICLGHTNLDLTARGVQQAERTAEKLSEIHFDKVYSSDLIRAMNTALPHARMRGLDVIGASDLRELYFGEWENRAVADLEVEYGDMFTVGWRQNFGTFVAPQGESVFDMASRAEKFLLNIANENDGKTILIASHAALIRALWGKISGYPFEKMGELVAFPSNASYSIVDCDSERLIPISYSNDAHLADLRTALPMK